MTGTRNLCIEFFKKHLGFSDESIIMIDQKEILEFKKIYEYGEKYYEQFSSSTYNKLSAFAASVFENFKRTGYSNQLLTIGITECKYETSAINWFFRMIQNFELNIYISSKASEQNAQTYLQTLASKIKDQRLYYIEFSEVNSFF